MGEIDIITIALNQGFAIAVCIYLLYERTSLTNEMLKIMERLVSILDRLEEQMGKR